MILAGQLTLKAQKDAATMEFAAMDFMHYSGYVTLGFMWLKTEVVCCRQLAKGG